MTGMPSILVMQWGEINGICPEWRPKKVLLEFKEAVTDTNIKKELEKIEEGLYNNKDIVQ